MSEYPFRGAGKPVCRDTCSPVPEVGSEKWEGGRAVLEGGRVHCIDRRPGKVVCAASRLFLQFS